MACLAGLPEKKPLLSKITGQHGCKAASEQTTRLLEQIHTPNQLKPAVVEGR